MTADWIMQFKHALGLEIQTRVAGLKGIITSRSENLYGCNRYFIQPKVVTDMKIPDGWWVDEDDVIVIGQGVAVTKKDTGGVMSKQN